MIPMSNVFSLLGMLFILMFLGMFLRHINMVNDEICSGLTDIVLLVVMPFNIVESFMTEFSMDILRRTAVMFIISLVIQFVSWLLAKYIFKKQPEERIPSLQYGTICPNAGILGAAVAESIFGSEGLLLDSIYLVPQRIMSWTVGLAYFEHSKGKFDLKKSITHPCIVAIFIGLILLITQYQPPAFITETIHVVGRCNTGMCMLLVGMLMGEIKARDFIDPGILFFCLMRLVVIPLMVFIMCIALHVDVVSCGVAVSLTAMPAGATTAILAAKYNRDPRFAAGCVAVSSILSAAAIPLWCLAINLTLK